MKCLVKFVVRVEFRLVIKRFRLWWRSALPVSPLDGSGWVLDELEGCCWLSEIACFQREAEFAVEFDSCDFFGLEALNVYFAGSFRVLDGVPFCNEQIAIPAAPRILGISNKNA